MFPSFRETGDDTKLRESHYDKPLGGPVRLHNYIAYLEKYTNANE